MGLRSTGACLLGLLMSDISYAQLGQNMFIGNAKALALGNAVTADPPGIDAIHYNPAGLADIVERTQHLKFVLGNADIRADFIADKNYLQNTDGRGVPDPTANTSSEIDNFAVYLPGSGLTELPVIAAPLGGFSFHLPTSDLTLATAVYAPMMLGFTRSEDDPGAFYGRELGLSRITYLSPSFGLKLSESVSVGAGIGLSYTGVGMKLDYRAANVLLGAMEVARLEYCDHRLAELLTENLCENLSLSPFEKLFTLQVDLEETFSPTFNAGLLWQVTPWLSWGVVYQSEARDNLEGDVAINIESSLIPENSRILKAILPGVYQELVVESGNIQRTGSLELITPQHVATGISLQLLPSLKLNLDYKWTQTSRWEVLEFRFDEPVATLAPLSFIEGVSEDALVLPREYRDSFNWALGVEYQYSDNLALRFGFEPRDSGVPDDKRDFLMPLADFDLYGVGFEYRLGAGQRLEMAIGYGKIDEYVESGTSTNGNDVRLDNFLYNPSAGQDVHYTTEFLMLEFGYRATF